MRILFLSQIIPFPPTGGVLQRGFHLIKYLSNENCIDLIAFHHLDTLPLHEDLNNAYNTLSLYCKNISFIPLTIKNSRLTLFCALTRSILSKYPFSFFAYKSNLFKEAIQDSINHNEYDIIHFDTLSLSQYIPLTSNIKKTLTHHNIESILMNRRATKESNIIKKLFYYIDAKKNKQAEYHFSSRFNSNITCSDVDSKMLLNINHTVNSITIPNGVDTNYFTPDYKIQDNNSIIHVGALQSSNLDGITYFIEDIWPLIINGNPNISLTLVGGNIPISIKNFAKSDNRIRLTGFVKDIRPYVHKASVFIVPLRIGGGTKLKVLDALANGKAVVTTSIGAEGIDIKHNKHVIIADSPEDFSIAVLRLISNRNLRIKLGRAGREVVLSKYQWASIAKKLSGFYKSLI
jgi:glycosyltransferase involved in cell wall biosynthesis